MHLFVYIQCSILFEPSLLFFSMSNKTLSIHSIQFQCRMSYVFLPSRGHSSLYADNFYTTIHLYTTLHNWNPMCRRLYLLLKIFVHCEKPMNLLKYNNITFFIALFLLCGWNWALCIGERGFRDRRFSYSTSYGNLMYNCFWLSISKNRLLWNRLAKWTETWQEASTCPLQIKDCSLHRDWTKTWSTWTILFFSDSLKFKKSFHLNLMNCFLCRNNVKTCHMSCITHQHKCYVSTSCITMMST